MLRVDPTGWGTQLLIDLSTVNHTAFFREPAHFTFMAEKVAAWLKESPATTIRIWSAGCSSGQEPYSMAMVLAETLPPHSLQKVEIWASDLSLEMLKVAAGAIYTSRDVQGVSPPAAAAVLPAGPRAARGLVPDRPRDPRPREVPPRRPAEPDLAGADRLPDDLLPERVDLLRRRRADGAARIAWRSTCARGLAGDGQRRDPARAYRRRCASIPRRCSRRRVDRPWLVATVPRRRNLPEPEPIEVLVVDDSAVVRQRLKSIIESDPRFRVVLAADPYEAVERLKQVGARA